MIEKGYHSRSEEHTSELQSRRDLVCRLLLEKNKLRSAELLRYEHDTPPGRSPIPLYSGLCCAHFSVLRGCLRRLPPPPRYLSFFFLNNAGPTEISPLPPPAPPPT